MTSTVFYIESVALLHKHTYSEYVQFCIVLLDLLYFVHFEIFYAKISMLQHVGFISDILL